MLSHRTITIINLPRKESGSLNTLIKDGEEEIDITIETEDSIEKKYTITEEDERIIEAFLLSDETGMSSRSFLELTKSLGNNQIKLQNHPLVLLKVLIPNETSEYGRINNYKMNQALKRYLKNAKK
ncbi:hypothetical protein [Marinilactibacillus psychrotolerans]|uniref:Uncharacterized protein n=1 Tax=Marinilactibacillus psychrotolerans TaxID=191770 RepID=A0AAV3WPB1_9LACT|nr:hypothetical protein [Marinilactibacillus psychrotolerans]GEL67108.1 hypothetical protein MPS01_12630 [Marinilactibacillus psychrotolerans]GEQ35479.1 hypothetical protein M132T_09870 [Marinilactibacillus psychrotolerans]SDC87160.1 hypothetical protein SAMN04488013_1112 [Marinilactibacillus psychrotolerans]